MEYWLYKIIVNSVAPDTYVGYKRVVTGRMKDYFTMKEHKKTVKEIIADDLDDFYDYLRENKLKNATIDHYNDNISSAFKFLLKKKLVRYNPTDQINPIVVDIIELPTLFDAYYGIRRSEIFGLKKSVFDFENNTFTVNHVAIQFDGKDHKEKILFRDKTKSKKGCRAFPLFPEVKEAVKKKLERIEENKKIFGDTYNYKYDDYICVQDNGDFINPGYFTKRFAKIIKKNNLKKVTPHGLRHSIATLLHLQGVDIKDLQDWLGHENITSTNRYTRSDYKKQLSTGNVVAKIFANPTEENKKDNTKRFIVKKRIFILQYEYSNPNFA